MAQTTAQAAVLQQTAGKFDQANESLQKMLSDLMAHLEVLQTSWRGAGGGSFQQVKAGWSRDQAALHRALAETASAIRTSGRHYDVTDSQAASRMNSTDRGGVQLPL